MQNTVQDESNILPTNTKVVKVETNENRRSLGKANQLAREFHDITHLAHLDKSNISEILDKYERVTALSIQKALLHKEPLSEEKKESKKDKEDIAECSIGLMKFNKLHEKILKVEKPKSINHEVNPRVKSKRSKIKNILKKILGNK